MITRSGRTALSIIVGSFFVAGGLAMIFFIGQASTLVCYRIDNRIDCRLQANLLGIRLREVEIGQLQSAEVDVNEKGHYRVMLVTNAGNVPLTRYHTGGRRSKREKVRSINAFIVDPTQLSLEVRERHLFPFPIGGIFILVGLALIVGGNPISDVFSGRRTPGDLWKDLWDVLRSRRK